MKHALLVLPLLLAIASAAPGLSAGFRDTFLNVVVPESAKGGPKPAPGHLLPVLAEFLIEQIRELTTLLPVIDEDETTTTLGPETGEAALADYDDVDDFDGFTSATFIGTSIVLLSNLIYTFNIILIKKEL